jgi:hypothetical protein
MEAGETRQLTLEVRFDAEPIEGRLYEPEADDGLDRAFCGWLGLLAAVEAARRDENGEAR